ncbi:MAG TPA: DNA translocase FtsK [Ruminococcaceae bacterium]|nr:DNA translocase FtsK [Oscillospiraceae bacterium]
MHGLFGIPAYVFGPFMITLAVLISSNRPNAAFTVWKFVFAQLILCAAFEIFITGKVNGANFGEVCANLYTNGVNFAGGGFFALILGVPLLFLGKLGASIIIVIITLVCVVLMIDMPLNEMFGKIGKGVKKAGTKTAEGIERRREQNAVLNQEYRRIREEEKARKLAAVQTTKKIERDLHKEAQKRSQLDEMKDVVGSVGKTGAPEASEAPKAEKKPAVKLPPERDTNKVLEEQRQDSRDYREALKKYMEKKHPIIREPEKPDPERFVDNDADLVPIVDALDKLNAEKGPARVSKIMDAPRRDIVYSDELKTPAAKPRVNIDEISEVDEAELPFDIDDIPAENAHEAPAMPEIKPIAKPEFHENREKQLTLSDVYTLPPMSLLNEVKKPAKPDDIENEIHRNAQKLVETLKSFGVQTTFLGASRGPSVTRYELQPAPGVKISKISGLADDVALNLAVSGVRIAPVPDKAAVGIEIPNKVKETVFFRELVDSETFKKTFANKLDSVLGKDISGETVRCNVSKMPHLLIAGTTGSGKSVCVNSIIMSILMKSTPSDVRLIMVDPKQVEFMMYNGIPHLLIPVVTDPKKAAGALAWSVTEMENRYTLFSENNVRNIDGYNELVEKGMIDGEIMPRIVIFIDELADLMMASPKDVEDSIVRLAQKARAAGMHLVIATQKPTVQVVTGLIKGNIPSRIALMVASQVDSRVILDASGAEKLLGNGDMLYMPVGSPKPIRLQGCYVSDDEVERVVEFIKQTFRAEYDENIMAEIERQTEIVANTDKSASADDSEGDDADEKLGDAIEFVVTAGQASTSALQRHLKLGYGRAARLIDTMEKMGIVGPFEGSKPRAVLMTKQEWYERKLRN